tara:strand:- start:490 stop:648 length:159 start_codon:yes stop_codon:yes gene_type:complete
VSLEYSLHIVTGPIMHLYSGFEIKALRIPSQKQDKEKTFFGTQKKHNFNQAG